MRKIILASSSPRRKELLEKLKIPFTVLASNIDEILDASLTPKEQVESLSRQKAHATAQLDGAQNALIIAGDSMVFIGNQLLGKPKDADDAIRMLQLLRGNPHDILTGFTILDTVTGHEVTSSSRTTLWFRDISDDEIKRFVEQEKPYDKAGAYGMQEIGAIFIEKLEGDYMGGIGLPLFPLAKELRNFGVTIL